MEDQIFRWDLNSTMTPTRYIGLTLSVGFQQLETLHGPPPILLRDHRRSAHACTCTCVVDSNTNNIRKGGYILCASCHIVFGTNRRSTTSCKTSPPANPPSRSIHYTPPPPAYFPPLTSFAASHGRTSLRNTAASMLRNSRTVVE